MATKVSVAHKVRDYDSWRPGFNEHASVREQHGLTNAEVYRGADDPNSILIVMDAPSREALLGFVADPSLKTAMENGGVVSEPTVVIGEILAAQPA
ncbi:MAG: cyclase [Candidatus Dormiibacterota bacterium]